MSPVSASSKNNGIISDWEAGVSLAKAIMGAGSFALPWAFSKMGYIAGPIFMTIFLGLSVHSIGLLVDCACWLRKQRRQQQQQQHKHGSLQQLTYVEVARSAFGPMGATLSYLTGISASIGVCGSYLVFVAVNLESLLSWSSSSASASASASASTLPSSQEETSASSLQQAEQGRILVLIWTVAMPLGVLLSSVRDPKRFAAVSFWGDVSVVAGMLAVLVYGIAAASVASAAAAAASAAADSSNRNDNGCVAVGSLDDMALAFGSIGYLFLVHFLVLPIESSMVAIESSSDNHRLEDSDSDIELHALHSAPPTTATARASNRNRNSYDTPVACCDLGDHKKRFQSVVLRTFAICGGIGGFFGIAGYLLFGSDTEEIVLLNVRGGVGMTIVQFLLCVDLLLTYPVVMRPSIGILEQHWSAVVVSRRKRRQNGAVLAASAVPSAVPPAAGRSALPISSARGGKGPIAHASSSPSSCSKRGAPSRSLEIDGSHQSTTTTITDGALLRVPFVASCRSNDNHNGNGNDGAVAAAVPVEWKTHMAVCLALGGVAAGAATFVPAFGMLSGLVGGVSQTFLAFVLPPLMWAKQRERLLLSGGRVSTHTNDDPTGDESVPLHSKDTAAAFTRWSFLRVLPWRERLLVLCGFGLAVWTLRSTWAELGDGKRD